MEARHGLKCKRPGGKLRPAQQEFLDNVRCSGGAAAVVASVTELARFLDEEGGDELNQPL